MQQNLFHFEEKRRVGSNYNLFEPLPYGANLELSLFDVHLKPVGPNFPDSVFICSVKIFCTSLGIMQSLNHSRAGGNVFVFLSNFALVIPFIFFFPLWLFCECELH